MQSLTQPMAAIAAAALLATSAAGETRTFTSTAGTTIRGELVAVNGDTVTIKSADGRTITTGTSNLSAADVSYVQTHALSKAGAPAGPASATKEKPFVNILGMKFVPVPGTSVLFSTTLTKVTHYEAFEAETRGKTPLAGTNGGFEKRDKRLFPVSTVSWEDAQAFCAWLSKKDGNVYRLPTDREWSVAVGIGGKESATATPEELDRKLTDVYPWGTQWPPPDGVGNYSDDAYRRYVQKNDFTGGETIKGFNDDEIAISPVETFKPNKLGLHDMGGNLWQWCEDWYDAAKTRRLLRGGGWGSYKKEDVLASARWPAAPGFRDDKSNQTSFRCVLVTAPAAK